MFKDKEDPWIIVQVLLQLCRQRCLETIVHISCKASSRIWMCYLGPIHYQGQEIHGKGPTLCLQAGNQAELLGLLELPTLEERRVHMKLCLLYKIIHELCYFISVVYFVTGTVLIMLDLTPCHSTNLLPELMPITFLLYLTLYLCGTHLILGVLMNLCVNLKVSFSGAVIHNMLHCFTCTLMVCKLELSCKYNCIV